MSLSQSLPRPSNLGFALTSLLARRRAKDWRPQRHHIYWALMATSITFMVTWTLLGEALGPTETLFRIGCSAGCGWSWLLARSLFQPTRREPAWPLAIVVTLFLTGALLVLAGSAAIDTHPVLRMVSNIHTLTSSTVLLLGSLEALNGYGPHLSKPERRFRIIFALCYGAMVTVAVLWSRQSAENTLAARWDDAIDLSCASIAFVASWLAVRFRDAHPLSSPAKTPGVRVERKSRPLSSVEADRLSASIRRVLKDEDVFTTPDLKVADLSRMVGAADYKVTQCITGALGFRNFNHMINHFRIERAKEMLADAEFDDQSILAIAMDCGFASIGPFNRAFKAATDTTPRAYRAASHEGVDLSA